MHVVCSGFGKLGNCIGLCLCWNDKEKSARISCRNDMSSDCCDSQRSWLHRDWFCWGALGVQLDERGEGVCPNVPAFCPHVVADYVGFRLGILLPPKVAQKLVAVTAPFGQEQSGEEKEPSYRICGS